MSLRRIGCSVADCPEPHDARGLCAKHYDEWKSGNASISAPSNDEWLRKPLKSDNLELTGLSPGEEANLCSIARSIRWEDRNSQGRRKRP